MNISGKTVLVTEGTEGLGEKTVRFLAEHGAGVYYLDQREENMPEAIERIIKETKRIDLIVNSLGEDAPSDGFGPVYLKDIRPDILSMNRLDAFFAPWLRSACRAFYFALPHMMKERAGLIINLPYRTLEKEFDDIIYEAANAAVYRMTRAMAVMLAGYGIAAVTLQPGAVRPAQDFMDDRDTDMHRWESPALTGRAVQALAADADIMKKTGRVLLTAELAQEYGFPDIGGIKPMVTIRQMRSLIPVR